MRSKWHGADRIGEVGNWASEGQASGEYGAVFTVGFLVRVGAKGEMRGPWIKVNSDKELT